MPCILAEGQASQAQRAVRPELGRWRPVIYEAIPTFLKNAGKAALGASTSPGLCLNNGKKFGFLSEPNCIWHLAAQSGVTHEILRFKEVGKKEKPSRGKRGSKQAGVQSLAQTKESQSGEVEWPMSKGQVNELPRCWPQWQDLS